jgi:ribonuclease HI
MITSIYCDGGTIGKNPSPIGGTWGWCAVDEKDNGVIEKSGYVLANGNPISNNYTEFLALLNALEAMEDNWSGYAYSDSQLTLGRFFHGWKTKNIPEEFISRAQQAVGRLGKITPVLLSGHPTRTELKNGMTSSGRPVSHHNARVDTLCTEAGKQVAGMNKTVLDNTLNGESTFTREYSAKNGTGEVTFKHLDDLLEFIQTEMLTASSEKEIVVRLKRVDNG